MLVYRLQQLFSAENLMYFFLNIYELQLQCVDIRSKPGPFSFLAMVFELQNNCAQQLSGQCPPKTLPQVDWQNKLTAQDTANRKNILERAALHMVGASKVWIDQSGFSRQEELYHRDVQWMFTERHWSWAPCVTGYGIDYLRKGADDLKHVVSTNLEVKNYPVCV